MNTIFKIEVNKFKAWADTYLKKSPPAEWECDYQDWPALNRAFLALISEKYPTVLSKTEIDDLIYVIARDNEMEELIEEVASYPKLFELLLQNVLKSNERDAKWQFAVSLGKKILNKNVAENALLQLVEDSDEYVSRMALQSLGKIHSTHAEALCKRAWDSDHEYQRIMALWVLKEIGSNELTKYLHLAIKDGRKYVVQNANEIKNA
ncbi:MAG: HEAT repeat domain-containing protein [candidate division Zixibacteria bacterium]|nr:HEAT repeat domain-containing protein [candidate division Zixibacteria bacterium]